MNRLFWCWLETLKHAFLCCRWTFLPFWFVCFTFRLKMVGIVIKKYKSFTKFIKDSHEKSANLYNLILIPSLMRCKFLHMEKRDVFFVFSLQTPDHMMDQFLDSSIVAALLLDFVPLLLVTSTTFPPRFKMLHLLRNRTLKNLIHLFSLLFAQLIPID